MTATTASSPLTFVGLGFRAGLARTRVRAIALSTAFAAALVLTSAAVERSVTSAGATDRMLATSFGLVIPLYTFAVVGALLGRRRPADLALTLARFGAPRREVAVGLVAAFTLVTGALTAAVSLAGVALAHGARTGLVAELVTTGWIAALAGGAYAAWFCFGATFFRHGWGRVLPLLLDFAVGGAGFAGALLVRGNAMNLLGFAAPMGLDQRASSAMLAAGTVALVLGAGLRSRG